MKDNETIHDRITQLVNEFGKGKNTVFASIIGSNEANVRGYKTSVMPKFDFLEKIARNIEVDLKWLLTGEGSMLRSDQTQPAPQPATQAIVQQDLSGEAAAYYKMYEKEKDENKVLLKENGRLEERLRHLETREQTPDHPPLAFDDGFVEAFTSEPSGGSTKDSTPMRSPTTSSKKSSASKI